MTDSDPLLPESPSGRMKLGAECVVILSIGIYSLINWPPNGIMAKGIWVDIFKAIVLEMLVASIPFSTLGLMWAIATPDWIPRLINPAFRHVGLAVGLLVVFGLLGMIAGFLGWW